MHGSSSQNHARRLFAADIFRYLSFLAILIFHMSFALWAPFGLNYIPPQNSSGHGLEVFARALSFSGFTVLFLSFFLFGFRGNENKKFNKLPFYILAFAAVWTVTVQEFPYWWDIYPFLLATLVILQLVKKIPAHLLAMISGTIVSIPFWKLEPLLTWPTWLTTAAIGVCTTRADLGDWPLLPWAAYPLFAFAAGKLAEQNHEKLKSIRRAEALVWAAGLGLTAAHLGKYYVTPIGEDFGCFAFRQEALTFWAHQIPIFLGIRISLIESVSLRMQSNSIAAWFAQRPVNRYFFVVYFLHYPIAQIIAALLRKSELTFSPYALTISCAALITAIEAGPVVISRILPHNIWKEWRDGKGSTQDSQLSQGLGS